MNLDQLAEVVSPKQIKSIVEAGQTPQIALWSGAVSSGKTIASLIAFLIHVPASPEHGLILIVGRTLQTIERNIIAPLQSPALFGPLAKHVHHTTGSNTATIIGRTVHLVGASDAKAEGRIRGATIGLALVDEATLVPKAFWMMLLSRLRIDGAKLLATTNPDSRAHWLRTEFLMRGLDVGLLNWHFTLDDNPSLTTEYVDRLKTQYVGLWNRRFILGEWCLAEGAVYDMFDSERHVVDTLPGIDRWVAVGLDYGTVNPLHGVMVGVGEDRRLYVTSEYRYDSKRSHRQLTDAEYSQALTSWLAEIERPNEQGKTRGVTPEHIYVDPSAASFQTQLWRDRTPNVAGANNDVLDGIRTVSSLLAMDSLRIHSSCAGLIDELTGYAWDPGAADKGEDKPLKIADHGVDALRYAVHSSAWAWRPLIQPLRLAA